MTCAACGAVASDTGRFCGACGALVRPRAGTATTAVPAPPDAAAPRPVTPPDEEVPDQTSGSRRRPRPAVTAAVVLVVLAALAAAQAFRPQPEVVTADGGAGPDGSNVTSTHAVTDVGTELWQVPDDAFPRLGGVFGLTDTVTAVDELLLARAGGLLHAVDRVRGDVAWQAPSIEGTPTAVAGRLPVLAEGELVWLRLADGGIDARHELDAPSGDVPVGHRPTFAVPAGDLLVAPAGPAVLDHQGSVRWHGGADGRLVGVHGGVVVVDGDSLRGLELATGEVRWERTGTEGSAISPAAALVGDTLVMVDAGRAVGLDPATGVERWRSPLPGDAAVGAGARLAGLTDDVAFVAYEQGDVEVVVRVGVRDGRLEPVGELGGVDGFPVQVSVAGGIVVSSGGREGVRAHRDGELLWSADVEQLPGTATVVDDDVVVLEGHRLRGLDLRTGKTRWTVATPMVGSLPARPAVLHGQAVVMAHSRLRAVDPATGETAWEEPVLGGSRCCPDHLVGPDHVVTAGPVRVFDAAGEQRWAEVPESSARLQSSAVAIVGPWVLTRRFEPSNGAEFRLRGLEDGGQGPTIGVEGVDPQVVHDDARFHAVARIGGRRALAAFPIPPLETTDATLAPAWMVDQPAEVQLVRTGDELLVVGRARVERRDPATGELLGRTPLPALVQPGVAVSDGTLVGLTAADTLAAIDVATGELRWRRTFAVPLGSSPTVAGDRVYVTDVKSVLRVLSLRDGDETATRELRLPAAGTVTVAHGLVLVPTGSALVAVGPPADRADAAARAR